jgi:glycine/D-amino acid oxidase-like deaminating enzyme
MLAADVIVVGGGIAGCVALSATRTLPRGTLFDARSPGCHHRAAAGRGLGGMTRR